MNTFRIIYLICIAFLFAACEVEETSPDTNSNSNNNGTKTNLSINLDGANDYVEVADASSLDLTSAYTVEAWVYFRSFNELAGIVSKYQSNGAEGYTLRLSRTSPYNEIDFDGVQTTSADLQVNTWYHIVGVNDGGDRRIYIDGSEMSTSGSPEFVSAFSNSDPLRIGVDFNSRFLNGQVDDVRVWSKARSTSEIVGTKNSILSGTESGLVLYYIFESEATAGGDNSDITIVEDESNRNNDGTLVNMSLVGSISNWDDNVSYTTGTGGNDPDPLALGDTYEGGIIYFLDGTGEHGLLASPVDVTEDTNWETAKNECENYTLEGNGNWRLPSITELELLYDRRQFVGGFAEIAYWSSSVDGADPSIAYGVFFGSGSNAGQTFPYFKTNSFQHSRAIREF